MKAIALVMIAGVSAGKVYGMRDSTFTDDDEAGSVRRSDSLASSMDGEPEEVGAALKEANALVAEFEKDLKGRIKLKFVPKAYAELVKKLGAIRGVRDREMGPIHSRVEALMDREIQTAKAKGLKTFVEDIDTAMNRADTPEEFQEFADFEENPTVVLDPEEGGVQPLAMTLKQALAVGWNPENEKAVRTALRRAVRENALTDPNKTTIAGKLNRGINGYGADFKSRMTRKVNEILDGTEPAAAGPRLTEPDETAYARRRNPSVVTPRARARGNTPARGRDENDDASLRPSRSGGSRGSAAVGGGLPALDAILSGAGTNITVGEVESIEALEGKGTGLTESQQNAYFEAFDPKKTTALGKRVDVALAKVWTKVVKK